MTSFSPRSWLKSWRPASRAARGRTRRTAARLNLESLEDRQLLAVFTVINTNNAGAGSLRQAILNANTTTAPDEIRFSIGAGPRDLAPTSPLPEVRFPVTLDGTTQPGYSGTPLITISGHLAGPFSEGLVLGHVSDGSVVRALTIRSFNGHGIVVRKSSTIIENCYIGIDPFQTVGAGNRDAGVAIEALPGFQTSDNVLRGNVISGNGGPGVMIKGTTTRRNVVQSSYIGTNATGTVAVPNGRDGVLIEGGSSFNTIGGGPRPNIISGNTATGVAILGSGTLSNEVWGNYLGTNASGTAALSNRDGVFVGQGARLNSIGLVLPGGRNLISGNRNGGVVLADEGTSNNTVRFNFIGTNAAGTAAVPNQRDGVSISNGARDNTIGGTFVGAGNIISGNFGAGVALLHGGTRGNIIQGNHIGITFTGGTPLGNLIGVFLAQAANQNTIGGSSALAGNVIAANRTQGVLLRHDGTSNNVVQGNYIGTNAAGTAALGNSQGVQIALGASLNTIGGTTAGARNLISGNRNEGVELTDAGTVNNLVLGNYIGTDAAGAAALGNRDGVRIVSGAQFNEIGGSAAAGNLISGNTAAGVSLMHSGTRRNRVRGNTIGLNAAGTAALGNFDGVSVAAGANGTAIGGSNPGQGNVIAANQRHGIVLWDAGTSTNAVGGNYIGFNADSGVAIGNGASANTVGGVAGEGNVIAYNGYHGIVTIAAGPRNLLRGNAVYENGALGIDVDNDWVTFAHVVYLVGASTSGPSTTVEGWVIGAPNATYTVELFENVAADPWGFGEGETPLAGLHTVSTDADGFGYLLVTLPFAMEVGRCVSATATQFDDTTWEFGNCLPVVAGGSPGAPGRDAAWVLSQAPASGPVAPQGRERFGAEGTAFQVEGTPFRNPLPEGAAADAVFGDVAPLPSAAPLRRTAAVFPGEDSALLWDEVFASNG